MFKRWEKAFRKSQRVNDLGKDDQENREQQEIKDRVEGVLELY